MPAESILAVSAATWGIAMGLSPALQIRQMLQTRSSRDVSVGYFTVLNVGFVLWASYGISLPNAAVLNPTHGSGRTPVNPPIGSSLRLATST